MLSSVNRAVVMGYKNKLVASKDASAVFGSTRAKNEDAYVPTNHIKASLHTNCSHLVLYLLFSH